MARRRLTPDRLSAIFRDLTPAIKEALLKAHQKSAEEAAERMRAAIPVDEGDHRDSITVTPPGGTTPAYSTLGRDHVASETEYIVTVGDVSARVPHIIEHGSETQAARPFFWPVVRMIRDRIRNRDVREVSKVIKKAGS